MLTFKYQARNKEGTLISGIEEASNRSLVINKLREKKLFPIKVVQVKHKIKGIKLTLPRLSDREIVFFTRQFSNLLESGITLSRALSLLVNQTSNVKLKDIITDLNAEVSEGGHFWKALARYPDIFSRVYIGMVKAGENSGTLDQVMGNLADFAERKKEVKDNVVSILIYPIIVLITGLGTVIFLMMFVVPRMLFIFRDIQGSLPLMTRVMIGFSVFLSKFWWVIPGICLAAGFLIIRAFGQKKTRLLLDELILKLPLVREVTQKIIFARFSYVMGLLLANGLSILECLDISTDTIGNTVIRKKLESVRLEVAQGSLLSAGVHKLGIFPQGMADMISVGEETGHLDKSLLKIAHIYDKQVKEDIKRLLTFLEPALIFFVALVIGFLVMAMLLPLFEMNLQIQ